jgi:hypothetical protein
MKLITEQGEFVRQLELRMDRSPFPNAALANSGKKIRFLLRSEHYMKDNFMAGQDLCAITDGSGAKRWRICAILAVSSWLSHHHHHPTPANNPEKLTHKMCPL